LKYLIFIVFILFGSNVVLAKNNHIFKECDKGNSKICYDIATDYLYGNNGAHINHHKALKYFEKACQYGSAEGCYGVGYIYDTSMYIKPDIYKAIKFYEKACYNESSKGCYRLGNIYNNGNHVKKNIYEAIKYYKKACQQNHADGCNEVGVVLINSSRLDSNRHKKNKYLKNAYKYYKKACALNSATACKNLADMHTEGLYVKINKKKGYQLYKKSCELGFEEACDKIYISRRDRDYRIDDHSNYNDYTFPESREDYIEYDERNYDRYNADGYDRQTPRCLEKNIQPDGSCMDKEAVSEFVGGIVEGLLFGD
jgi:TPR repeat protein